MAQFLLRFSFAALAIAGLFATGCAGPDPASQQAAQTGQESLFEWQGYGMTGKTSIVIDLTTQRAEVYRGGQYAGWTSVATGKAGFDTPAGNYTIVEKVADKHSNLYGKIVDAEGNTINPNADVRRDKPPLGGQFLFAPMPYWMRLTWSGIGMHAGPIPQPGTAASHGCIRLPDEMAELLFDITQKGTPVKVVR